MRNERGLRVAALLLIVLTAACKSSGGEVVRPVDGGGGEARDGATRPDISAATCTPEARAKGEECSCALQCESGFCADGVCCETACSGACLSCAVTGSMGTCTPTPAGAAPRDPGQCRAESESTCGLDGTCDGAGQCRSHVEGTVCRPGTCDGDSVVGIYTCDGLRGCKQGPTTVCAPFSCDPATNQCFARCATDLNCVSGRKCVDASCGPKQNGSVCERASECASEHCVGASVATRPVTGSAAPAIWSASWASASRWRAGCLTRCVPSRRRPAAAPRAFATGSPRAPPTP